MERFREGSHQRVGVETSSAHVFILQSKQASPWQTHPPTLHMEYWSISDPRSLQLSLFFYYGRNWLGNADEGCYGLSDWAGGSIVWCSGRESCRFLPHSTLVSFSFLLILSSHECSSSYMSPRGAHSIHRTITAYAYTLGAHPNHRTIILSAVTRIFPRDHAITPNPNPNPSRLYQTNMYLRVTPFNPRSRPLPICPPRP